MIVLKMLSSSRKLGTKRQEMSWQVLTLRAAQVLMGAKETGKTQEIKIIETHDES